jgi:hypothetical protein
LAVPERGLEREFEFTLLDAESEQVGLSIKNLRTQQLTAMAGILTKEDVRQLPLGEQVLLYLVQGAVLHAIPTLTPRAHTEDAFWDYAQRQLAEEVLGATVEKSTTHTETVTIKDESHVEALLALIV